MNDTTETTPKITDITRAELHALVWEKAMIHVAADFGITGTGLAKICDRHKIPCPPRGYWAKLAVGRALKLTPLPPAPKGMRDRIVIHASEPRLRPPKPEPVADDIKAAMVVPAVVDDPKEFHPLVRSWIAEHKRLQRERAAENNRRRGRDQFFWKQPEIGNLTERDLYRFRITSALFRGLEKAGATIKDAPISGRISLQIGKQVIAVSIVEKMSRGLAKKDAEPWTAFPEHHQNGLVSSGYLRVAVTTFLEPKLPDWIETEKQRFGPVLADIVAGLLSAGPIRDRMDEEKRERDRIWAEAQERARQEARLREIDMRRLKGLQDLSDNWQEAQRLRGFIDELERRAEGHEAVEIDGMSVEDWIAWARRKADAMDPFGHDFVTILRAIAQSPIHSS